MLKKIQINGKLFLEYFKIACGVVFGIASAFFLFFDTSDLKIKSCSSKILTMTILILLAVFYAVVKVISYKKIVVIKGKLVLRYGDLWKTAFNTKEKKKIVVVGVNTTFDTIVDENLSMVNKPLVSPTTIHGRWLKCMKDRNVEISDIDAKISNSLKLQGISPMKVLSRNVKARGKLECYSKGTIAQYE